MRGHVRTAPATRAKYINQQYRIASESYLRQTGWYTVRMIELLKERYGWGERVGVTHRANSRIFYAPGFADVRLDKAQFLLSRDAEDMPQQLELTGTARARRPRPKAETVVVVQTQQQDSAGSFAGVILAFLQKFFGGK